MLVLAVFAAAAGADAGPLDAAGDDVPPMIFARKPVRIMPTSDGYYVTYGNGQSERWIRTGSGFYAESGRFTRTRNGYVGNGERYERTSQGWFASTGQGHAPIRATTSGYYHDGVTFYRTSSGYMRTHMPASSVRLVPGPPARKVIRMEHSQPSSFRRWSDRTAPPLR